MTPSQLKAKVEAADHAPHFFTRRAMSFFGDTMGNFGVATEPVTFTTYSGEVVTCWELYRRKPVKCGLHSSHYFCTSTFRKISRPME